MLNPLTDRRWHLMVATTLWIALLYAGRFHWLEVEGAAVACENSHTALCWLRGQLGYFLWLHVIGWVALAASLLAIAWPRRLTLIPALACTALGLVLYSIDAASLAGMITLVALARMGR